LDLYILDGQQRITALFHAVSDVSDYCYYVDFGLLQEGEDDFIRWQRRDQFQKNFPDLRSKAAAKIATIKEVWDLELFYEWLENLPEGEIRSGYVALRERRLGGLQAKVYKVMAVELDQEIELEALARIFETLNRTGVRLSAFDLMVAALYPSGFRLRDAWEEALANNSELQIANIDSNEILKLISLQIRKTKGKSYSKGVRQGDLLAIDKVLIRDYWPSAINLYVRALNYCRDNFGLLGEEVMPTPAMVLGVAMWLSLDSVVTSRAMKSWWLDRLASQHYSQAANTRIISDVDAINSGAIPITGSASLLASDLLEQPARRNGIFLRGFAGLLISQGACDPISGDLLKDCKSVGFCAIDERGILRKMNATDALSRIVFTTQSTEVTVGRGKFLGDFTDQFEQYLASQGVDLKEGRTVEYVKYIFEA